VFVNEGDRRLSPSIAPTLAPVPCSISDSEYFDEDHVMKDNRPNVPLNDQSERIANAK
jgi:hypothetical protein